jgi:Flp pilus assembly protein TadD
MVIGHIQRSRDRYGDAITAYEEVLKRQARPVAATLALASVYLSRAEFDRAETYVQQTLALAPNLPDARALQVRLALGRGDQAQARQLLAALRKEFPNSPAVMNLTAAQQISERQFESARATYAKAAALRPSDLEPLAGLVQIDLASGRTKEAVARIDEVMGRVKPSAALLALAAQVYARAGQADKAEAALKQAIDIEPARLQAYGMLASLYIGQRRLPEAKAQFERLATLNPRSVTYPTMLGMLFDTESRTVEAEAQYERALSIDPTSPVAANNLAWIYVASDRNMARALDLARTALRGLPDDPNVHDTLGWIYYKQNLTDDAIRHLETAAKTSPKDPLPSYHLGMAYLKKGETQKARTALQQALSLSTSFDGAAEAKQALSGIGG